MVMTAHLHELIVSGAGSAELHRAAVAGGMRPMALVALDHVQHGLTTLEEVDRVLGEAETDVVESETSEPRVLLVDDDPVMRQIAKFVLSTAGYKVIEVEDGRAALDYIRQGDPVSLVVLDLDMPGLSGLDVLEALRADRATMSLPVVVLTGAQGAETKVMDAGADDYIRKPLEPEPFLSRIKAVLRRSAM